MTNDEIVTKMQERMAELDSLYDIALQRYESFHKIRTHCDGIDLDLDIDVDYYITYIEKNLIMDYYEDLLKSRFDDIYKEICYLERLGIQSNRQKLQYNM